MKPVWKFLSQTLIPNKTAQLILFPVAAFVWVLKVYFEGEWGFTDFFEFTSILAALLVWLLNYFKEEIHRNFSRSLMKREYDLIIGVSETANQLAENIASDPKWNAIWALTKDQVAHYERNFPVIVYEDISDLVEKQNLAQINNILISTGDDKKNIDLLNCFLEELSEKQEPTKSDKKTRITIEIQNRELRPLCEDVVEKALSSVDIPLCEYEDISDLFEKQDLAQIRNILISTGDDKKNIDLLRRFLKELIRRFLEELSDKQELDKSNKKPHITIEIQNRELRPLCEDVVEKELSFVDMQLSVGYVEKESSSVDILLKVDVVEKKLRSVDIQFFSFTEACIKSFLMEYGIEAKPEDRTLIESDEDYSFAIIGSGQFAEELFYQLGKLAHLPNENILSIHLFSPDANKMKDRWDVLFKGYENIPTLKLIPHAVEYHSVEFMDFKKIANVTNLKRIFILNELPLKNLQVLSFLKDRIYLEDINKCSMPEIYRLDLESDNKFDSFNFIPFGSKKEICTYDNVFDDNLNRLGKQIHASWGKEKNIDDAWYTATLNDRRSSEAQALHARLKLKALGFKAVEVENQKAISPMIEEFKQISPMIEELNCWVERNDYKTTAANEERKVRHSDFAKLSNKLIRSEKNRWNAFHYMNNWQYSQEKKKAIRRHNLLLSFSDFLNGADNSTIKHDIESITKLADYFSEIGCELRKIDNNESK